MQEALRIKERRRLNQDYIIYLYPLLAQAYIAKLLSIPADAEGRPQLLRKLGKVVKTGLRQFSRKPA